MEFAVEIASGGMICIPGFVIIGLKKSKAVPVTGREGP
jgi:hypothetical protein